MWEIRFLLFLQKSRFSCANIFWYTLTLLGYGAFLPFVISLLLTLSVDYRTVGITSLAATGFMELLLNRIIKILVGRERPFVLYPEIKPYGKIPDDKSFPSGHTSSAFSCAIIVFMRVPTWIGLSVMILAGMIAFSRLYLGVHYPTDVIGGILCAALLDSAILCLI